MKYKLRILYLLLGFSMGLLPSAFAMKQSYRAQYNHLMCLDAMEHAGMTP